MKKLPIIGAGGYGKVVEKVAEVTGKYEKVNFIDNHQ